MTQTANAIWNGTVKEGNGTITTQSKALNESKYSFKTRFEDANGTNPDELLASSHAGCFAMALSLMLGEEGFPAEKLDVKARITMDPDQLAITNSHLTVKGNVPKIDAGKFEEIANNAKENCPISKALSIDISMDAHLV